MTNKMMRDTKNQTGCGEMIRGNCTDDDNPDAWVPEGTVGNPGPAKLFALATEVKYAVTLCNSCPKQEECLEEGMEPKNLPYGIWGGKLAGQRILMADERGIDYMSDGSRTRGLRTELSENSHVVIKEKNKVTLEEKRNALNFLRRMRPWIGV